MQDCTGDKVRQCRINDVITASSHFYLLTHPHRLCVPTRERGLISGSLAPARESVLTLYVIMLPYAFPRGSVGTRISLVPIIAGSLAPARESVLTLYVVMLPYAFPRGSVGTRISLVPII